MDWLWGLAQEALAWLGLINKKAKLIIVGLDNAGKTTLLGLLSKGVLRQHIPTPKYNREDVTIPGWSLDCFDLGGAKNQRHLWGDFFPVLDGVVFIVDASDRARLPDAKSELQELLRQDTLHEKPVLVLGNKIDAAGAVSEPELRFAIELPSDQFDERSNERPVELFMCSILQRHGYNDGLLWLANHIKA